MAIDPVDILQKLIRNECVNDGTPDSGHEHRSVALLQNLLAEEGTIYEPAPGRQSVLFSKQGGSGPHLMFMGHLDVVPANPADWSVSPFDGVVRNGMVWGRGAVDMLNIVACMAAAYEAADPTRLQGRLSFLAVADEEAGGMLGAEWIVDHHWDQVSCDGLLSEIAYPSPPGSPPLVNVGEKGPHWQLATTTGTAGHGSQPYGTDNALVPLARMMAAVSESDTPVLISDEWRAFVGGLELDETDRRALVDPDLVDAAIDRLAVADPGFARYVHACTHLTMTPTILNAGTKANVVPDRGQANLDIRMLPGQDETTVHDHLRKILGGDYEKIRFETKVSHPANSSSTDGGLYEAIRQAFAEERGSSVVLPTVTPATTDARFWRDRGVPCYGVGSFDDGLSFSEFLGMFHARDERVTVESLHRTADLYERIAGVFLR